jgi:hypothetical protein
LLKKKKEKPMLLKQKMMHESVLHYRCFSQSIKRFIQCAELTDKSPALIFSDYREPSKTHRLDLASAALILALARDEIKKYDFGAPSSISTLKELAFQPNKNEGDFNLLQIARLARFYHAFDLNKAADCIKNNRRHSKRSTLIHILQDLHKD